MDISKMLQQANKMKQELDKKEKAFDEQIFTYEKQGIKLIISGALRIQSIYINEALIDPEDKETLEDLIMVAQMYEESNLPHPAIIVDTNHSNSGKRYEEQVRIAKEVLHSMKESPKIAKIVKGLMIESYLEDGCQSVDGGIYGKSITDPCLGWDKTEKLILEIAEIRKKQKQKN